MSNIPKARELLRTLLDEYKLPLEAHRLVVRALREMNRRKAAFRAPRENKRLTPAERRKAKRLREMGFSLAKIAKRIGTDNLGRVSEAVSGKAH